MKNRLEEQKNESKILVCGNHQIVIYNFRKELLERLIKDGHRVCLSLPYGEKIEDLKSMGCEFIDTPIDRRSINPIKDLKLIFFYYKLLKKYEPDVVLTYTIKPNIYGGIVCRFLNISYIENITGLGAVNEKTGLLKKILIKLYKIALKKSSCVFFQNKSNMDFLLGHEVVKNNYRLIPGSGVNLTENKFEKYLEDDNVVRFLFAGRVYKIKGMDELLEAIKIIKSKYNNIYFDIVGFAEKDYDNSLLWQLHKNNMLVYHGQKENVHEFIKNSHAVILPSYSEGMSNILLESAACGRPILASNIPGCKEICEDGVTGFLFKPKSVESLVEAIEKFFKLSYEKKIEMGKAGRKKVEKEFDRNLVIDAYIQEINKIKKYKN